MTPDIYFDMIIENSKTTIPYTYEFDRYFYSITPELWVWLFVYFGSFFIATGLSAFVYNYIVENRFAKSAHVQKVFIVRSNPEFKLENEIVDYIKDTASKPFRIISVDDTQKSHVRAFHKFMKRLINTNEEIYILGRNWFNWEYENYIYLCNQFEIPVNVIEFSRDLEVPNNYYPIDLRTNEQIIL